MQKLKTQEQPPKNDFGRSSPLRAQVGKANSIAVAAVLATTTTTVVKSAASKPKIFSKKRQRAGKRAMRLMVKIGGERLEKQDSPEGREKGLDLAIADPAGGVQTK